MKKFLEKLNTTLLVLTVPLISGCGGGGGLSLNSLFGSGGGSEAASSGGGGSLASLSGVSGGGGDFHNPEPASMLLMGSGIAAMAYAKYKNKNK